MAFYHRIRQMVAHMVNVSNPHSVTAAQIGLTGPMDYKGGVAVNSDFPTSAAVGTGDTYMATAAVTDNDATKTNTGQSFLPGERLTWNGTGWDVVQGDLTPAAQTAGSGTAGTQIPITAGAGAAASGGTAGAAGGALTMAAGVGGASDGTDAAANGGAASLTAGAGGAASGAIAGANGAAATLAGGAGGAGSAGAAGGDGGNALLNAGAGGADGGGGAGTDGTVQIGSANTAAIQIANATDNPATTFLGTGLVTMPALTVSGVGGIITLTPAAQVAGGGTVGSAITATAGAGSAAAGAVAGANGGATAVSAGAGGASDGTDAAGNGGAASLVGGVGGVANTAIVGGDGGDTAVTGGAGGAGSAGALGGAGGDVTINAGAGGVTGGAGAGADGNVLIGAADTGAIQIGNATDNPGTTFLGTGTVTIPILTVNGLGNQLIQPAADAAGSTTAGATVTIIGGAGAAAGAGSAAAAGGALLLEGGDGGASDGTDAAANGAAAGLAGGAGGAAHTAVAGGDGADATVTGGAGGAGSAGAAGGDGGDVTINAGAGGADGGGGAGTDGSIAIGAANTVALAFGNVTDNTTFEFLGTGDIDMDGGGDIINHRLVQVVITATGGTGGSTAGTISVQVNDLAGNAIGRAVQLRLDISDTDLAGDLDAAGTCQFGAASTGTLVVGSGAASAIVTTDATGLYEGALSNAADETNYFSASTTRGGFASAAAGCVVVDCQSDSATWSA